MIPSCLVKVNCGKEKTWCVRRTHLSNVHKYLQSGVRAFKCFTNHTKKNSGAHSRVATLIQPSFQKRAPFFCVLKSRGKKHKKNRNNLNSKLNNGTFSTLGGNSHIPHPSIFDPHPTPPHPLHHFESMLYFFYLQIQSFCILQNKQPKKSFLLSLPSSSGSVVSFRKGLIFFFPDFFF